MEQYFKSYLSKIPQTKQITEKLTLNILCGLQSPRAGFSCNREIDTVKQYIFCYFTCQTCIQKKLTTLMCNGFLNYTMQKKSAISS